MVAPKRVVLCTANFPGPLGQRAGSRPSFSALACRCAVADVSARWCVLNMAAADWLLALLAEERSRG
jgi:hypothetical protein